MSSEYAIEVCGLGKSYHIYDKPVDRLKQMLFRGRRRYYDEFWALQDVSFMIRKGETVGIIGRNGSGKSTLLQMICGTVNPTSGDIKTHGRVAALLELGAGFNPEFSGVDNVYMAASLYGLSEVEISERFDDITAFADIGDHINQPVKTYSSGMYVRLAFAVIAHVDPEILVIDEALAVGDLAFQSKCMLALRRMMDAGVTVLFVSHDTSSVRNLCQQVLWLDNGRAKAFGDPERIIGAYVADVHQSINRDLSKLSGATPASLTVVDAVDAECDAFLLRAADDYSTFSEGWRRYGDGRAYVLNAELLDKNSRSAETILLKDPFSIRFIVSATTDVDQPAFGFSLRDFKGNQIVGSVSTNYRDSVIPRLAAGKKYLVELSMTNLLAQGSYTVNIGIENIVEPNIAHEFVDVVENAIVFRSSFGEDPHDIFPAMVWQDVAFSVSEFEDTA